MELRTLEYFLAVAREGNISNAAKALHITQPTLSRQLSSLEKEFGRELYTRGPKGIELTDQGSILCRYAESIVELARKAEEDMLPSERSIGGTVHIGAGESQAMTLIAQAMDEVRRTYPAVDFAIHSGTTAELKDGLVRGFYDVMLECEMREHAKMNTMHLPVTDVWGAVALRDSAVGRLEGISPADLVGQSVIASRQALAGTLRDWAGDALDRMDVVATFNLPLNGRYLVRQGMSCMLTYEGLFDASESSDLRFVPFRPALRGSPGPRLAVLHAQQADAGLPRRHGTCMREACGRRRRHLVDRTQLFRRFPKPGSGLRGRGESFFSPTPSSRRHETSI